MTQVVINKCFGGFGLSHEATMEYGRRAGTPLYAFTDARDENGRLNLRGQHVPVTDEEAAKAFIVYYFTTPDPDWKSEDGYFSDRDIKRDDAVLVQLVRDWGSERVSGRHAKLAIVEVPDDAQWEIEEYDGAEHVAEAHRTWS